VTPAVREEKAAMQNETENCKNRVNEKAKWYSLVTTAYSHVNQFILRVVFLIELGWLFFGNIE